MGHEAKAKLELANTLDAAMKSKDSKTLAIALAKAEQGGLGHMPVVKQAQATSALQKAMRRNTVESLEQAISAAVDAAAPKELVAQARQLLADKKSKLDEMS